MQRTIEVEHPGTHYPTEAQNREALIGALKGDGLKVAGTPEFVLVVNTSGGPSKVRATFEAVERTKTVGGDAKPAEPEKS